MENEHLVNGIDARALAGAIACIAADPAKAAAEFRVRTARKGGTRSETVVEDVGVGGVRVARTSRFAADERHALFGTAGGPNPKERRRGPSTRACSSAGSSS